jgi:hypothetical protein
MGGMAIPEGQVARDAARNAGQALAKSFADAGIQKLDKKQLLAIRLATEGRFKKLHAWKERVGLNDPQNRFVFNQAMNAANIPIKAEHLSQQAAEALEKEWSKSPLTKNIFSRATRGIQNVQPKVNPQGVTRPGWQLAGNAVGGATIGVADPVTGLMNVSKTSLANPLVRGKLNQTPLGQRALHSTEEKLVFNPVQNAVQAGLKKQPISPLKNTATQYGLNALTGEMAYTGNNLARAAVTSA